MLVIIDINGVEERYRIIDFGEGINRISYALPVGADGRLPESQNGAIDLGKFLDLPNKERRDKINERLRRSN